MKEHAWHQGKIPSFRDSFGHVYDKVGALHDVSCVRRVPNGKSYRCYAVGENAQTCTNLPCDEIGVIVYSDDGGKRWSFGNVGGGISILTGISCIGPGPGECVAVGNGVPDPGAPRTALIATMDASGRWNPSLRPRLVDRGNALLDGRHVVHSGLRVLPAVRFLRRLQSPPGRARSAFRE